RVPAAGAHADGSGSAEDAGENGDGRRERLRRASEGEMSETTPVMTTDLDRLSERVEKAAALVQQLRDDRARLERERDELASRLKENEKKLKGQDVAVLMGEVTTQRREQGQRTSE